MESLQPYEQWAPGAKTLQLLLWRMTTSRHSRYWISRSLRNNLLQMLLHRLFNVVGHTTDAGYLKEARLLAAMLRSSLFFLFHWLLDIINKLHTWSSFYFLFFSYIYLNRWETLLSCLNLVQYALLSCISGNVVSGHKCLNFSSSSRSHYAKPCKVHWKMGGTKVGGKNKAMIKFFLTSCFFSFFFSRKFLDFISNTEFPYSIFELLVYASECPCVYECWYVRMCTQAWLE